MVLWASVARLICVKQPESRVQAATPPEFPTLRDLCVTKLDSADAGMSQHAGWDMGWWSVVAGVGFEPTTFGL